MEFNAVSALACQGATSADATANGLTVVAQEIGDAVELTVALFLATAELNAVQLLFVIRTSVFGLLYHEARLTLKTTANSAARG